MLIMLLALFLVTMFLGTPIAFSMSFASIVTNLTHGASSLMLTAQQCYDCGCVGRHDFCSHFRLRPCYRGGFGCLYDSCYGE